MELLWSGWINNICSRAGTFPVNIASGDEAEKMIDDI